MTKPLRHLIGIGLLATLALTSCTPSPPKVERNATGDLIPYSNIEKTRAFHWANGTRLTMERQKLHPEIIDDTHIRIPFNTGPSPDCFRYNADVVETPTTITITLSNGWIPNSDKLCKSKIMNLSIGGESIAVETKDPINGRKIIDGTPEPTITPSSPGTTSVK